MSSHYAPHEPIRRRALARAALGSVLTAALLIGLLIARIPPAASHGGERHDVVLTGGRWWDGSTFVPRERVYSVGGELRLAPAAVKDTVDLAGRWVLPPLADAHTHLLSDTSGFSRTLRRLLEAGVLYAQNPNSFTSQVAAVRSRLDHPGTLEMRFANGGLTSPGGHPVQIYEREGASGARTRGDDAYFEVADRAELDLRWPRVLAGKPDFIKVYLESSEFHAARAKDPAYFGRRGLDPALLPELVRRASAAGLPVSAHVTSAADFRAAVAAGVKEIAHLPLAPITREDAAAAARAGVTVVTTVVSHRPAGAVADPNALHRENLRLLREAGVAIVIGTDHPMLTAADEAIALARLGGFTPAEVLRMLTETTTRYLHPGRKVGRLAAGDEASFVVLEGDPIADLENLKRVAWSMSRGYRVELPVLPPTKPSIADSMAPLLMRGDLPGALALHERTRRERPNDFDFGEQQLNALGYRMLQHGAVEGALAIFRRNAEVFPNSANVHDSMADAHLAARDSVAAAASYRKLLEMLPANPHYSAEYRAGLEKRAKEFLAGRGARP
jgi:imidazolonepropionase-like amidohydrolase